MEIFYRKSDNKFCGSMNIDKKIAGNDEILNLEVDDKAWLEFIQTAQEIYIENGELVSKEIVLSLVDTKLKKIKELKDRTKREILEQYSLYDQVNITNLINGYTSADKTAMKTYISEKIDSFRQEKELINLEI